MSDQTAVSARPSRSPAYPALDLGSALARAEALYRAERQNPVPIELAVRHWGYKSPNGRSNLIVSALKKYGLIVDSGSGRARKIQVTDATRRILEHPVREERLVLIQKAALLPPIHNEMWRKYGADNMPSNDSWAWELKEELDFTDSGAADFIKEYRETIRFAELGSVEFENPSVGEDVGSNEDDELGQDVDLELDRGENELSRAQSYSRPSAVSMSLARELPANAIAIPMPGGGAITLNGAFPISESEWAYMQAVLSAMKPGLVISSDASEQVVSQL